MAFISRDVSIALKVIGGALGFAMLVIGGLILMIWLMASIVSANSPNINEGEQYVTETTWGPVVEVVGGCWMPSRHQYTCWVKREGMEAEALSMNLMPGGTAQVGERIGVRYHISDTVVKSYTIRESYQERMVHRESCFKSDPKCYWPSKK